MIMSMATILIIVMNIIIIMIVKSSKTQGQRCPIRSQQHHLLLHARCYCHKFDQKCCPTTIPTFSRLKTGVQIVGGVLAILSGVILVLFFAKLDEVCVNFQSSFWPCYFSSFLSWKAVFVRNAKYCICIKYKILP